MKHLHQYSLKHLLSFQYFYEFSAKTHFPLLFLTAFFFCLGIYWGFFLAPMDYQQGEGFRIIYVHVPAAFWSLGVYSIIFVASIAYLIWQIKLFDAIAMASSAIGAIFTLIALITGSLWGKPMWGTWWVWDARLTSELLLLFLYLGYMGLRSATKNVEQQAKIAAVLAIIGMVDVPIVHFSVNWWNTLHQGATLARFAKPAISSAMLIPLLIMMIAFGLFYLTVVSIRLRCIIMERSLETRWMKQQILFEEDEKEEEENDYSSFHSLG